MNLLLASKYLFFIKHPDICFLHLVSHWNEFLYRICNWMCSLLHGERFIYYLFCSHSNCVAFGVKGLQRTYSSKPLVASMDFKDNPNNTALFGHVFDSHENWLAFLCIGLGKKNIYIVRHKKDWLSTYHNFVIVLNETVRLILTLELLSNKAEQTDSQVGFMSFLMRITL